MKIAVIATTGEITEQDVSTSSEEVLLDGLQKIVGGYLEQLKLKDVSVVGRPRKRLRIDMFFNEDGKQMELPANQKATDLITNYRTLMRGDFIAGTAFISAADAETGRSEDLPEDIIRALKNGDEW